MIRLLSLCLLLPFAVLADQHEWRVYEYYHAGGGSLIGTKVACIICGAGSSAPVPNVQSGWCTCHSPQRSVEVRARHLCYTDGSNDPAFANDLNGRLHDMTPAQLGAIDWGSTADNISPEVQMFQWYPNGSVVDVGDGSRGVVTEDVNGNPVVSPFVDGSASGYSNGRQGTYTLNPLGDNMYSSNFTPNWSGGVSDNGSSSPVSSGSSSSVVVPYSSGSGSSTSSGSTVFDQPTTETRTNDSGENYHVISVPAETVNLGNGSSITMRDYSGILNAIGGNLSSGFSKLHDDVSVINENIRKQLESSEDVSVAENHEPDIDISAEVSEGQGVLDSLSEEGSGWRFDFGMGSNPVGNLITGLIGNPPTSFGECDHVCSVSFDLPLAGSIQYEFNISDWFPPAFRSCILMILSIIFAIASAKAISGAFS